MSIGLRISIGFGATLLLLITVGVTVYVNTITLIDEANWVAHTREVITRIDAAAIALGDQESGERGYVLSGNDAFLGSFRRGEMNLRPTLDELVRMTKDNAEQQARLRELQTLVTSQTEHWRAVIREFDQHGFEAARALIASGANRQNLETIRELMRGASSEEARLLRERKQVNEHTVAATTNTIIWGTIAGAVLVALLGTATTRSITRPLLTLTEGAAHIGAGNLGYRIRVDRSDETGTLCAALNSMADSLSKTLISADLERQARERVESLLATISDTANTLVSSTAEILAATTQQAAGAQEQAAAVAETVTTVNEVVQTSEQASERARMVAEAAQRSLEVGKTGRRVVDESVQMMSVVKEQVEASTEGIMSLAEQAQSIGTIISTVTEIAEQTNLLALNAAIEASRAGEQGRGFSVVAAEIKALAGQSKKATAQVRQILGEIQRATNGAVMTTEECSKSVNGAVKIILQAGETIRNLSEVIAQAAQASTQIAASAGQQAAGTSQIHQAMQNINQVTNQNLGSTRQMEQAARDLNVLGGRLRERLAVADRGAVGQG
jgi:methyl-accepting chemotaxis protein